MILNSPEDIWNKRKGVREALIDPEGGSDIQKSQSKLTDDEIQGYGSSSVQAWIENPEESELAQFSLFLQLNGGDSDLMASYEELQPLLEHIKSNLDDEGMLLMTPDEKMKQSFAMYQKNNFLTFRSFQTFLKDLEIDMLADKIDRYIYLEYFKSNCLLRCLARCCGSKLRKIRMSQCANILKKFIEIEQRRTPTKPMNPFMYIIALIQVNGGYLQIFDFYMDIYVVYILYYASIDSANKGTQNDYQFALTVCFLSLVATFMAQQSCIIGMKFAQGDFEPQIFRNSSCFKKLKSVFLLTFIGSFLLIPIELLENLGKMIKLPGLLLGGIKGSQFVDECIINLKKSISNLNTYQLNCLEQQRRVSAMLFENLPFTFLIFAIKMQWLNCPELSHGKSSTAVNIALASTISQVMMTIVLNKMESSWLNESTLSYLMTKMTSNNNWIPFIHLIAKRQCFININYGNLAIKMPILSHILGVQNIVLFEFSDCTLSYLLNELKLWSSEVKGCKCEKKNTLTFTKDCLNEVSLNALVHFVQNFPEDVYELDIQLDWFEFYEKKLSEDKIDFIVENGVEQAFSPTGVPLLQLCIQNEKSSSNWPLKDMLSIILKSGKFSIQGQTHESPLAVAVQDNCFESLTFMINGEYKIDYQQTDSRGLSLIGQVMQKLQNQPDNHDPQFDQLQTFAKTLFDTLELDFHKPQFENTGSIIKSISAWQLVFKNLRHHRAIRPTTKILLDKIESKGIYELKDNEKQTLFKNTIKLLMAHGQDADQSFSKLAELCKKCGVDVFTTVDKNNNGLSHRMVRSWPLQITDSQNLARIFKSIETQQMNDQGITGQTFLFRQILEQDLILNIFKGSIHSSEQILKIDSQNRQGKIILNLNTPELRQPVIKQLAISRLTLERNFVSLIKLVKERFNDSTLDELVQAEALKYSLTLGKDEEDQDKEKDNYMFKGKNLTRNAQLNQSAEEEVKLTRCKERTSNLKRKVCDQMQGQVETKKLTADQMDRLNVVKNASAKRRKQIFGSGFRIFLETLLEWISAADLYTDFVVLLMLLKTEHHAWTTLTIFSMIAPFFACQTPYLMFLREKVYRDTQSRFKLNSMGWIMVTPIMLGYMFVLDVIFVINQAFLYPVIVVLKFLTCGIVDLSCLSTGLEKSYEFLFEMHSQEVAGFRRMRTISQLTFESLIQVLLQTRMLMYFNKLQDEKEKAKFGVSGTAILISVILALSHALLESLFLYMEAKASRTSFINYCIICFNGRFGWVPYNDYLIQTSQLLSEEKKPGASAKKIVQFTSIELDYEHIHSKLCCFEIQVDYMFTDTTIQALSKTLAAFPPIENEKDMPVIKFGSTINMVSIGYLVSLLKVCVGRVKIDIQGSDLKNMLLQSKYRALVETHNASQLSANDKALLFDIQNQKLFPLLKQILLLNQELLRATKQENNKQVNLIWEAYYKRDHKLLDLLLSLDSDVLKEQMAEVTDRSCLTLRFIDTMDFDIWQQLAINTTVFDPHQESIFFQAFMGLQTQDPAFFNKSLKWWHSRFGPSMPQELVSDVKRWSSAYDFMMDSRKLYPEKVYFYSGQNMIEVECKTAFCFATIRKKFVHAWNISSTGPAIDKDQSQGTLNNPMNISDLEVPIQQFKLLNMLLSEDDHHNVKNLDENQVNELDKWAVKLKLDISRWLYVGRSRQGDESGNQIEVIFHGKDIYSKYWGDRSDKPQNKLSNGSNNKINKIPYNQMTFQDSVEVKMPLKMTWITNHETSISMPQSNTVMSCFIFQQDTNFLGYLFSYGSQKKLKYIADGVKMAKLNELQRQAEIDSSKGYYMLGSLVPGSRCIYSPHPLHHADTTCRGFRIKMDIDFPPDVDINQEQQYLENQAQRLKKEYEDSIEAYTQVMNSA